MHYARAASLGQAAWAFLLPTALAEAPPQPGEPRAGGEWRGTDEPSVAAAALLTAPVASLLMGTSLGAETLARLGRAALGEEAPARNLSPWSALNPEP